MTRASYASDLQVAIKELGASTPLAKLTPRRIGAYFESDAVTKTRAGKQKAMPTILKCRRVLRLALSWAHKQGWIQDLPIPSAYLQRRGQAKDEKKAPRKRRARAKSTKASA
jgi:hypothetical protein